MREERLEEIKEYLFCFGVCFCPDCMSIIDEDFIETYLDNSTKMRGF